MSCFFYLYCAGILFIMDMFGALRALAEGTCSLPSASASTFAHLLLILFGWLCFRAGAAKKFTHMKE